MHVGSLPVRAAQPPQTPTQAALTSPRGRSDAIPARKMWLILVPPAPLPCPAPSPIRLPSSSLFLFSFPSSVGHYSFSSSFFHSLAFLPLPSPLLFYFTHAHSSLLTSSLHFPSFLFLLPLFFSLFPITSYASLFLSLFSSLSHLPPLPSIPPLSFLPPFLYHIITTSSSPQQS